MSVGVENIKNVGSLVKLGAIAICQGISKDGFQGTDLFAPLKSNLFMNAATPVIANWEKVLEEAADLGPLEILGLAQGMYLGYLDVQTEAKLALKKINDLKGK